MCGIFGHFHRGQQHEADVALVRRMAMALAHRGPDGFGIHHQGALAFGAGRLAIIDLAAAAGPLFNEDRTIAVVFNGEIYNHQTLRADLIYAGHIFTTHTDSEVLVHGYEQWGVDLFTRLHGMFAIGIWDVRREQLLLVRDRLGEKPLYYAELGSEFLFASEIKALFEHTLLPRCVNAEAVPHYLTLGYVPPPLTMFEGVFKLAPGELIVIDKSTIRKQIYWRADMNGYGRNGLTYPDAVRQVREAVFQAVESRLMSDVPLGAFLSGGLDSTAVVAIMAQLQQRPVRTFTVGFEDDHAKFNVDDTFATLAAHKLKTEHSRVTIVRDERLAALLPHLIYAMDEPIAQPAIIQTAYVAALARKQGIPVLLSGDASDELFAGYPSYRADRVLERYLKIPTLLRRTVLTPLLERLPARWAGLNKLAGKAQITDPVLRYLTWMKMIDLDRQSALLAAEWRDNGQHTYDRLASILRPLLDTPTTPHFADRMAFTSLNLWIAEDSNMRVDKMSMMMSVETRAPLEDHRLVKLAHHLPLEYKLRGGDFKRVLKDAVRDIVPAEILYRPKWGFFPPISTWLRTIFKPLIDKYLSPEYVTAVGWFDPAAVSRLVEAHLVQGKYELWPLWTLLVFHVWYALYIDGSLTLSQPISSLGIAVFEAVQRIT